jgi:hypothetical protein
MRERIHSLFHLLLSPHLLCWFAGSAEQDGWTALHFAANCNHKELIALLLSWPGILPSIKDKEGRTAADRYYCHLPLVSASASASTASAAPTTSAGATATSRAAPQRQPLQSLQKLNVWDAAERGECHWLYAKLKGRLQALRDAEHLEANPPPKLKPWEERQRREEEEAKNKNNKSKPKSAGSAMEPQIDAGGLWGRTPLHYCAMAGHVLCAHLLLRCKAEYERVALLLTRYLICAVNGCVWQPECG